MGSGSLTSHLHVPAPSLSLSFPWGTRRLAQIGSQGSQPAPHPQSGLPALATWGPASPSCRLPPPPSPPLPPGSLLSVFKLLRALCCHCLVPAPRAWLEERAPSQGFHSLAHQGLSWLPWTTGHQAEKRLPRSSQPTHLAARPQGQACIPGVVPGCPEAAALLRLLGPGEVGASVMTDDLLWGGGEGVTPSSTLGAACAPCPQHPSTPVRCTCSASACSEPWNSRKSVGATQQLSLLCLLQASIMTSSRNSGAKERPGEVNPGLYRGPPPESTPGLLTYAGHRHCSLEDVYGAVHRRLDGGEGTGGGHHGLRDRMQAQGGGCDEAQRSLGAHKEPSEVVAGCALPGPGDTRQMSAQATCRRVSGQRPGRSRAQSLG